MDAGGCPAPATASADVGVVVTPFAPRPGEPIRVLVSSFDDERELALRVESASGPLDGLQVVARRGAPSTLIATIDAAVAGEHRVVVGREGTGLACASFTVGDARASSRAPRGAVWPIEREWSAAEEALYSAWIREMFRAPSGRELSYARLDQVTSDPDRNLLHGALGLGEDEPGVLGLRPDCADLPYFLRAYWSWKRRLPFAFHICSRGGPEIAPRCLGSRSSLEARHSSARARELPRVETFLRQTIAWGVHSGNGRTAVSDSHGDFYPVALDRRGLRPGTIYADPYGHILVLVELIEPRGDEPGELFAIDGQPDGTITRKRFWEGTFLWDPTPSRGGTGFKRFRPVVYRDGEVEVLGNDALARAPGHGDLWTEHEALDSEAFHERVLAVITPGPREPLRAQRRAALALHEALRTRAEFVERGAAVSRLRAQTIAMPRGFRVFETTGPWETFATPGRDMRLLIAIDLVQRFAARVRRNPEAYGVARGRVDAVVSELEGQLEGQLEDPALSFRYTRSDGSAWTLTLGEALARAPALEVGYNPNDCPELRWGAPEGSEEASTCTFRAPESQRARMEKYRGWFRERRPPARGD
ncbi:MAG: hypothetical protein H6713_39405 [Myxococcales bacterium]|nr:hypothetical protein [Myxococcales bacterium]